MGVEGEEEEEEGAERSVQQATEMGWLGIRLRGVASDCGSCSRPRASESGG